MKKQLWILEEDTDNNGKFEPLAEHVYSTREEAKDILNVYKKNFCDAVRMVKYIPVRR